MRFEWDEAKNRANVRKHGFHFAEAEEMFDGAIRIISLRKANREERKDYETAIQDGLGTN
jgi:uncharacterized DUF497 family protein